jgi:hypothetical protein
MLQNFIKLQFKKKPGISESQNLSGIKRKNRPFQKEKGGTYN